ncbi:hypothetical protein JCM3765_000263 [Sporobolomyces pararoseus]
MPIPSLPNELIDQILRYKCLDDDDLIQACLVSRSWLEPARKSLWDELWLTVIEEKEEETAVVNRYPRRTSYRHHSVSWKLISILSLNPILASYVKLIGLIVWASSPFGLSKASSFSTSMPDLISSLLRFCPAATSFSFEGDTWFDRDSLGSTYTYLDRFRTLRLEDDSGDRLFDTVKQLPSLKTLHLGFEPIRLPVQSPEPTIKDLSELHLECQCGTEAFETLSLGSKTSLQSLEIPLNLLAVLDLSQYPNLRRLAITNYGDVPNYSESMSFLEKLVSSNLEVIDFSTEAAQLFSLIFDLHSHIPPSCRRVNFDGSWTLDILVDLIQRPRPDDAEGRLVQVGVPKVSRDGIGQGRVENERIYSSAMDRRKTVDLEREKGHRSGYPCLQVFIF